MKVTRSIFLAVSAAAALFGQSAPSRLAFEVASIKPSAPPNGQQVSIGVHIDGAQVRCNSLSLKDYLGIAYKVKNYQITGPEWLGSDRFDISAKLPDGANREQVAEMLQTLLEDRFQMKMHREKKEFPVYALLVAKGGLKMKEVPTDANNPAPEASKAPVTVTGGGGPGGTSVSLGNGSSFTFGNNRLEATKLPMAGLADTLARFEDRPVVDMTELKGKYNFTLEFSPEDYRAMLIRSAIAAGVVLPPEALRALDVSSGDSLLAAMQTVGLRLEPRKAPIDVLVVDRAQKTPTEN